MLRNGGFGYMRSVGSKGEYKFGCRWVEGCMPDVASSGDKHCIHKVRSLVWKVNEETHGCLLLSVGPRSGPECSGLVG